MGSVGPTGEEGRPGFRRTERCLYRETLGEEVGRISFSTSGMEKVRELSPPFDSTQT